MATYMHIATVPSGVFWYNVTPSYTGMDPQTSTLFVLANMDGTYTWIRGTGFTYDATGPTGGTVTELVRTNYSGDTGTNGDIYEIVTSVTGVNLVALFNALFTGNRAAFALIFNAPDTFNGSSGVDLFVGGPSGDSFNGGAGTDWVSYDNALSAIRADLSNAATNTGSDAVGDTYSSIENLQGSDFNDVLVGDAQSNVLRGGAGADTMAGGAGSDTYNVDNAGDVVIESPGEGTDTVETFINFGLTANLENLTLLGSTDLQGYGNDLANTIAGNTGNNLIDGRGGADNMGGGAGNDTYFVDDPSDSVFEVAGQGNDTVFSSANFALPANVENLVMQGGIDLQGYGNSQANVIYGNAGNNLIDGRGGIDLMVGGAGDDTYFVDDPSDSAFEVAGLGNDTVFTTANYGLAADVENLVMQGSANLQGYGNNQANVIYGNGGGNLLNAAGGIDLMVGGAGSDTYFVDDPSDSCFEVAGQGNDAVFASCNYGLAAEVETLVMMQGFGDFQGYGNNQANTLYGNGGNNLINGAGGADLMIGFAGNDTYFVDNAGDAVAENFGEGSDAVFASVSYALTANVESLVMQSGADLQGFGNGLANVIYGNGGNNVLDGGAGSDVLTGNAGNDSFRFRQGEADGDTIVDFAGNGAALGDSITFIGYGAGATFTQNDATHWQVNFNGGASHEVITLLNGASIDPTDYIFI
jgi:trimeric autotransporter adhesin